YGTDPTRYYACFEAKRQGKIGKKPKISTLHSFGRKSMAGMPKKSPSRRGGKGDFYIWAILARMVSYCSLARPKASGRSSGRPARTAATMSAQAWDSRAKPKLAATPFRVWAARSTSGRSCCSRAVQREGQEGSAGNFF